MDVSPAAPPTRPGDGFRFAAPAAALLALAALLAYRHGLGGPFLFDDGPSIRDNPALRHLWPPGPLFAPSPIPGLTTNGRPMVTLSLAFNYAIGGTSVWGYHAANLLIHVLAVLTLFGVVRRTLERAGKTPREAGMLGFAVALLWGVHPLQTEAVTYVVQRAESLMGLFYLLTLYCFIRGESRRSGTGPGGRPSFWFGLSWLACLGGMATKEVMVTAPVLVLLYDRTFLSGDFRTAWRRHRGIHLGLAGTWLLLGVLMAATGSRGGTAGFGTPVAWWRYAAVQFPALIHYLRLSLWPSPLVFDYGADLTVRPEQLVPAMAATALLVVLAARAFFCAPPEAPGRRALGFAGVWYFGILAPTSSVVPVATQTMAEHRMYLPLAAVVAVAVCAAYALLQRVAGPAGRGDRPGRWCVAGCLVAAAALGTATARRNADYRSELALWGDTVAKRPDNPDAQYNLGRLLQRDGRTAEAAARYQEAVRLRPDFALAQTNLALAWSRLGRTEAATRLAEEAVRLRPDLALARNNLGNVLCRQGRILPAIAQYREAIRLQPDLAEAHNDLAVALVQSGAGDEAERHFAAAVRLRPDFPEAYYNWANALADAGRTDEALRCYQAAVGLRPDFAAAYFNWGTTLAGAGRTADAIRCFETALQWQPDFEAARQNLRRLQATPRRLPAGPSSPAESRTLSKPSKSIDGVR